MLFAAILLNLPHSVPKIRDVGIILPKIPFSIFRTPYWVLNIFSIGQRQDVPKGCVCCQKSGYQVYLEYKYDF